jgi:hypothetical protein
LVDHELPNAVATTLKIFRKAKKASLLAGLNPAQVDDAFIRIGFGESGAGSEKGA